MPRTTEIVRENRLREAAKRQGYRLVKSRRRDPRALDFGSYTIVTDDQTRAAVAQQLPDLGAVEAWLTSDDRTGRVAS